MGFGNEPILGMSGQFMCGIYVPGLSEPSSWRFPQSLWRFLGFLFFSSSCHLWKNDRPPCSEGFRFEGVANFLAKGGKKDPPASERRRAGSLGWMDGFCSGSFHFSFRLWNRPYGDFFQLLKWVGLFLYVCICLPLLV